MKIQLKRSNQKDDAGRAKPPSGGQMEYGELAVNYNTDDPSIFLKDSGDNIIRIAGANAQGNIEIPSADGGDNQTGTLDDRYVQVVGDEMTGNLSVTPVGDWTAQGAVIGAPGFLYASQPKDDNLGQIIKAVNPNKGGDVFYVNTFGEIYGKDVRVSSFELDGASAKSGKLTFSLANVTEGTAYIQTTAAGSGGGAGFGGDLEFYTKQDFEADFTKVLTLDYLGDVLTDGNIHIGNDQIVLSSDGTSTFSTGIDVGDPNFGTATSGMLVTNTTGTTYGDQCGMAIFNQVSDTLGDGSVDRQTFAIYGTGANNRVTYMTNDGAAYFAVGRAVITENGVFFNNTLDPGPAFQCRNPSNTDFSVLINGDGSATFAGGALTIFNQGSIKAYSLEAEANIFIRNSSAITTIDLSGDDGSATFNGNVKVGDGLTVTDGAPSGANSWNIDSSALATSGQKHLVFVPSQDPSDKPGVLFYKRGVGNVDNNTDVYIGGDLQNATPAPNIKLEAGGSGTFSGPVQAGGNAALGVADGVIIGADGSMAASRTSAGQILWAGYTTGSTDQTSIIYNDGSAKFLGDLNINSETEAPAAGNKVGAYIGKEGYMSISRSGDLAFEANYISGSGSGVVGRFMQDSVVTTTIYANGDALYLGTITATVVPPSDARFKENIEAAKPQLADVVALGGILKNYDWNDEAPVSSEIRSQRQLGLIAQEAEKICPSIVKELKNTKTVEVTPAVVGPKGKVIKEAVTTEVPDNYKGISSEALIMKLIGAVAELSAEVEALKGN